MHTTDPSVSSKLVLQLNQTIKGEISPLKIGEHCTAQNVLLHVEDLLVGNDLIEGMQVDGLPTCTR
jgi:hypothetical protein